LPWCSDAYYDYAYTAETTATRIIRAKQPTHELARDYARSLR
jgi:hypothetical protein